MKKHMRAIALLLGLSLLATACNKKTLNNGESLNSTINTTDKEKNQHQYKLDVLRPFAYGHINGLNLEPGSYISIIGRYDDDSYWKEVQAGAKRAIADINTMLGYKGDDRIKISFTAPNERDNIDEQINLLDEELSRSPVVICIAAIDTTACKVQFQLAADSSVPIITFDSGSDYQDIAAHISTDNLEATATAATQLASLVGETGEIALFVQDSLSMTAKEREQGFIDTIKEKYPNISIANIYHMNELSSVSKQIAEEHNVFLSETDTPLDPDSISQEEVVEYILNKYPNLKGIYATNLDATQLVAKVLKKHQREDLAFVGFDGGQEQLALLENEIVDGLILQNPYGMGYATIVAAARTVLELGNEAVIDSGYAWVTKENMTDSDIKNLLY